MAVIKSSKWTVNGIATETVPVAAVTAAPVTVVHPGRYINEIARRMPELTGRDVIEEALDRLEYVTDKEQLIHDNLSAIRGCPRF